MARKPMRSHQAYKEWATSVRQLEQNIIIITHGKISGRATVNLKINILDSRTNHSSWLKKSEMAKKTENKRAKVKKKNIIKKYIYNIYKLPFMI